MSLNWTIEQLKSWIDATFPDNVARSITEADLRDVLNKTVDWVFETNSSAFIEDALANIGDLNNQANQGKAEILNILAEAITARNETVQERILAQQAVANAALGLNPLGEYDPATNTPTLSVTPAADVPVGSYYDVTVEGAVAFSGSNFASAAVLAVGGRLIKKDNTKWYYQPPSNLALVKAVELENKLGGSVQEGNEKLLSGNTVWESQKFLRDIEIPSPQLFDNNTMRAGNYGLSNGNHAESSNWICTPLIKIDPLQGHITGSGWGPAGTNTPSRFCFYGPGGFGNFISRVNGELTAPLTAEIPNNAHYITVTVANSLNIGLNPTNSPFASTFMLNYGQEAQSWKAYGDSTINESFIPGIAKANLALEKAISLENNVGGDVQQGDLKLLDGNTVWESQKFLRDIEIPSPQLFNKNTMEAGQYNSSNGDRIASNNWIRTPLIKIDPLQGHITGSGWTGLPSGMRFYFYGPGGIGNFISAAPGPGTGPISAEIPANARYVAVTVGNVAGAGLDPTNSPYASTFMLNYGQQAQSWKVYGDSRLDSSKLDNVNHPDNFFTFSKTAGSGGNERFTAYTKLPSSRDLYVGFYVDRALDLSELVYSNNFRIVRAYLYKYNGDAMTPVGTEIMYAGESECVYLASGRADFTGGTHGDELLTSISFLADGQELDIEADLPLTPAAVLEYRQISTMHETAATGDIVNPNHPIEAIHHKITTFEKGGYKTQNRLIWQQSNVPVTLWYHGIACIHKNAASVVQNEYLDQSEMTGDNFNKITKGKARSYFGRNSTTKLSAKASSVLLKPLPFFQTGAVVHPDNTCTMFVWDRPNDSKYYRRFNPTTPIQSGDEWESEMSVSFRIH